MSDVVHYMVGQTAKTVHIVHREAPGWVTAHPVRSIPCGTECKVLSVTSLGGNLTVCIVDFGDGLVYEGLRLNFLAYPSPLEILAQDCE